ncbi:MAG: hypothetical protein AB1774_07755 [Bacillota bacterium]
MSRLRRLILGVLLGPILPAFMWGPFTHVHVNRTALKKAKDLSDGSDATINSELVTLLTSSEEVERSYILAANSADAISSYHTLNNFTAYDYTHNSIPDNAQGIPNFGYTLVDTWRRTPEAAWSSHEDRVRDLAIACGWLSHQLADWYAHYACMDSEGNACDPVDALADEITTFSGYSDSHRVLGHDYPQPHLRRYNLADHGLTEFLVDSVLIFAPGGHRFENLSLPRLSSLKNGNANIITLASEDFDGAVRLPEDHIPILWKNMNLILLGMYVLQQLVRARRQFIRHEAAKVVHTRYVDLSVERVLDGLFRKSFDEIAHLARLGRRPRPEGQPIGPLDSRMVKYPGTIVFKIAYSLASSISTPEETVSTATFARALDIVENPLVALDRAPVIGPVVRWRWAADVLWSKVAKPSVDAFITTQFDSLGTPAKDGRVPAKDALLALANEVLLKRRSVEAARKQFATSVKPVITVVRRDGSDLPEGRELPTQSELLDMVYRQRELVFKAWPAIPRSRGASAESEKALDINSVRVNVNGFPVSDHPGFARLTVGFETDSTASPLLIRLAFGPAFRPGRYDIFVDVSDMSGVKAEYLYWPVDLRRQ